MMSLHKAVSVPRYPLSGTSCDELAYINMVGCTYDGMGLGGVILL